MRRFQRTVLVRKVFRDLLRYRWRALSIAVTLAAGIGITAGIDMAIETLRATRDAIYEECRASDLEVHLLPRDLVHLPDLERLDEVDHAERRLVLTGIADFETRQGCSAQAIFLEHADSEVNRLCVMTGEGLSRADTSGVVIEYGYATYHGIDVGDTLLLRIGRATYSCHVRGTVLSAEHLCVMSNPLSFIPKEGALAVVFGTLDRVSDRLGFGMANSVVIRLNENADRQAALSAITDQLANDPVEAIVPRERQFSYQFLELDLDALKIYAPAIQVTLGLLSLLIAILNTQRMITVQRGEIGILRTLGYGSLDMVGSYAVMGSLIGISGLMLGVPVAIALRSSFSEAYGHAIGMSRVDQHFFLRPVLVTGMIALFIPIGALMTSVLRLTRLRPQVLLRAHRSTNGARYRIPRVLLASTAAPRITRRWAIRNLARRPFLTTITVCAVGVSVGVAVAYRISQRSTRETARSTLAHEKWDLHLDFHYPAYPEEFDAILNAPGVTDAEPYLAMPIEVETGGERFAAILTGVEIHSDFRDIEILSGTSLTEASARSVLISPDMERTLGVTVGDSIALHLPGMIPLKVSVAGVTHGIILNRLMASLEDVRQWTQREEQASGLVIRVADRGVGRDWQKQFDLVANSHYMEEILGDITALIDKEVAMINIAMLISIGVGVLFLITSLNLAANERLGEYATIRALGGDSNMIWSILTIEGMMQVILAAFLALPVGLMVATFLNGRLAQAWFPVKLTVGVAEILPPLIGMIALGPAAILPAHLSIMRARLPEVLRLRNLE